MLHALSETELMALSTSSDLRRSAWIVADDPAMRDELHQAVVAAGLRATRSMNLADAQHNLADRPDSAVLIVDVPDDEVSGEAAVLARLNVDAEWRGHAAVVSFGRAALDRVSAQVSAPHAALLCEPSAFDRVAAIGYANAEAATMLQEVDAVRDTLRLQQIADEVARIARALAGATETPARTVSDGLIGYRAEPMEIRAQPVTVRADDIRTMIRLRRQRDRLFPADLFADPAWDMMLDLMVARIERLKVAVSSLCIAAAVPPTTALRWIRTLTEFGIFVRVADPTDGRRVFIELSDAAAGKLLDFLGDAKRAGNALV